MRGALNSLLADKPGQNPTIIEERVLNFLRHTPPFQFLPDEALQQVVSRLEIHFFPQDASIAEQGYLYVIERGGVKQRLITDQNEEIIIEIAGEGDLFGLPAALEHEAGPLRLTALTDTICYAVPQTVVNDLLQSQPAFAHYLLQFSLAHYLDWSLTQLQAGSRAGQGRLLFSTPAREIARKPLLVCSSDTPIQQAAQLMSDQQVGSVVIANPAGESVGIVTNRDLRERVIVAGWDMLGPIGEIMNSPLRTIPGHAPVYEALSLMLTHHIHHLVVTENDRATAMLTAHDLIMLQGVSTLALAREIDRQNSLDGLRQAHQHGQQSIPLLLQQGMRAGQLGRMMTGLNDRLVRRVIQLVEADLGPPPAPYCWLALGSEGRREQSFKTDQDNALIYADPPPDQAEAATAYFLEFGRRVVDGLIEIGFPPCPGDFMASNPRWTQSVSGWQTIFTHWIDNRDPAEIVEALLFFDLRGIYGNLLLTEQLYNFIFDLLERHPRFLRQLGRLSIRQTPPLGFLGRFTLEYSGEHKDEFDLKRRGIIPLVDLTRFLALQYRINETNTLQRLERLKNEGHLTASEADSLAQAYEVLLRLRIEQEWEQIKQGRPPSTYLNPKHLSTLNRRLLREAFKIIGQTQSRLEKELHRQVGRLF